MGSIPKAAKLADGTVVRYALKYLLLFVFNRSQLQGINVRIATVERIACIEGKKAEWQKLISQYPSMEGIFD